MKRQVGTFRGRNIYQINGYPTVYWPEHPVSFEWGHTYIHRIIAYDLWGEEVKNKNKVVHHIDGDPWNWSPDNLRLMGKKEHDYYHTGGGRYYGTCEECGTSFDRKASESGPFCSLECSYKAKEKIEWPEDDILEGLVWEKPVTKVAKELGVSDKAVSKRCKNLGIETPGRGYWQKKRYNKTK